MYRQSLLLVVAVLVVLMCVIDTSASLSRQPRQEDGTTSTAAPDNNTPAQQESDASETTFAKRPSKPKEEKKEEPSEPEKGSGEVLVNSISQVAGGLKAIIGVVALPLVLLAIIAAVVVFVLRSGYLNFESSVDTNNQQAYSYGAPGNGYGLDGEYSSYQTAAAAAKLDEFGAYDTQNGAPASFAVQTSLHNRGDLVGQKKRR